MHPDADVEPPAPSATPSAARRRKKSVWRKLLLLGWKNLLLRKRHWLLTTFEILLPALLFTLLLTIRLLPDSDFLPKYINKNSTFPPTTELNLRKIVCGHYGHWMDLFLKCLVIENFLPGDRKLFYGPPGNFTQGVAEYVADYLGLHHSALEPVATNHDMDVLVDKSYFETNNSLAAFYVGLYFHDLDDPGPEPPKNLNYDLRLSGYWQTSQLYPFLQIPGPRNFSIFGNLGGSYNMGGFTLIQSVVDRYYISQLTGDESYSTKYKLETQMYPYPPYVQDDGMSQIYGSILPTFIVLSLVLLSPSLIKSVVYEKETGVRELVRLMGLDGWLVWLGWFLHSFIVIVINATIITILLKVQVASVQDGEGYLPPILNYSDPFFLWVLLILYGISSIAFCFVIATFFSKPTLATTLGILVWLTSYFIPQSLMEYDYDTMGLAPKLSSCLLPNMALTWAFKVISMFEGRAIGVHWDNLWETGNIRDQLTPAMILLMLLLDTFLFLFITWYVDQVSPGMYGVPQRWYFPFQKTYWCGAPPVSPEDHQQETPGTDKDNFERDPVGLTPGIVIKNLRKEFKTLGGKVKVAVENVSMTCYQGQCTVLLGHNGAGKTTTMSVLTGVYAPSGGYAEVGGWNIATNLKEAREEVGLCPQHNMLFVDLTVMQHLLFFGRLKGMTTKDAKAEAEALLERLELKEKTNMFGNQLSGGMKRKLCLAIALIGGSKVVILDEPSSGLDPESRRWVWDVVQRERGRRTVLVTTHHMEEADVLGDRVAIMASGKVVCAGSTLFLKNKFGDGYSLTVMVSEATNMKEMKQEVTKHLPLATLRSAQGGEVTFKLPPNTAQFAPLLDALSRRKEELDIRHLGLSLTSMEQVFLRVGELVDGLDPIRDERDDRRGSLNVILNGNLSDSLSGNENINTNGHLENADAYSSQRFLFSSQTNVDGLLWGSKLLMQRIKAFFVKRAIYFKRKWVLFLTQGLLPVLVTLMCLWIDASFNDDKFLEPPLLLNISMFPYSSSFVLADPGKEDLAAAYKSLFWGPHEVTSTENMEESLLSDAKEHLNKYRENSVCSAEFLKVFGHTDMRMLYQSVPLHTPGVCTSLITNALLTLATNSSDRSIITTNRPLPPNKTWKIGNTRSSTSAMVYSMVMPLALAFLSASFLVFPLQERVTKAKQVQVMTGAPVWALWVTTFLWDFFTYLASAFIVFAFIMIFDSKGYFTVNEAPAVLFLLLLLYGWGSIPMAYVFSFPFQTAASGFAVLTLVNIFAGQIITTAIWALNLSQQPSLITLSNTLNWATSFIPTYPASMGFYHLVNTSVHNAQCDVFNMTVKSQLCSSLAEFLPYSPFVMCCPECNEVGDKTCFDKRSYFLFDDYGMAADLLTLLGNGIIFLLLLVVIEADIGRQLSRSWWRLRAGLSLICCGSKTQVVVNENFPQDDDVATEAALVDTLMLNRKTANGDSQVEATLLVSGLYKQFYSSSTPAVNKVSFRVGRGECLGLLGVNGAGKTTTFRMLTGDEELSGGDAMIGTISLQSNVGKFVQQIGYCPQFDAVLGELTGVEMLTLVGRLRGVSDGRMKHTVNSLVSLVGLTECAKRPSSTYSGGNRRKLSTAMALVGNPPLVFLDEPTSGVDPASRRRVWTAIRQAINNGQSVVLTSHSMEECEALCSRIIIMSRGSLRCVGTTGHLKAKFGQGYSLQVKLRTYSVNEQCHLENEEAYNAKVSELKTTIIYHLRGSTLTDQHKGMLAFRVSNRNSWGHLFSVMEALKAGRKPGAAGSWTEAAVTTSSPLVEDYAASDTSLEQVFLSFAREAAAAQELRDFQIPCEFITKL
ncbi:phospholipid-transporting ATPase ABCA3-like [Homarus americanus]|uniref:phospholipid-transporting ATPase ABCA3-like n=1 Tax=Homarus americanus TaxID=6706 RepID=UPI001C44D1E5|nr:phospholipid-transporting ATPase ABCA3-like [Homarus americanus]XP_042235285.1 phospholipid-transporting ATPase ABCA3-like [Homarus americanus]